MNKGDIISIKLMNEGGHPYFKKKVNLSDPKDRKALREELEQVGIDFDELFPKLKT